MIKFLLKNLYFLKENILLGIFDEIKLCDFGWSKIENPNIPDDSLAGTLNYLCK